MGNSQSTQTVINQTTIINPPPLPGTPDPATQPFVDTLLDWLIKLNNTPGIKKTGDTQIDLDSLQTLLSDIATSNFSVQFGYDFDGPSTTPTRATAGTQFVNFTDFTSCSTIDHTSLSLYLENVMFGKNSGVPSFALAPMRNDVKVDLETKMRGGIAAGWSQDIIRNHYANPDATQPGVEIDAALVYTIVNTVDGNNTTTPTLMLFYVGGYYHSTGF